MDYPSSSVNLCQLPSLHWSANPSRLSQLGRGQHFHQRQILNSPPTIRLSSDVHSFRANRLLGHSPEVRQRVGA